MKTRRYKFAETVIEINSPFDYTDRLPYTKFECSDEEPNYRACFEIQNELPQINEKPIFSNEMYTAFTKNGKNYIYYLDIDSNDFYACRISGEDDDYCKIIVKSAFKDKIWTRLVFDLIGVEEILAKNNSSMFHSSYLELDGKALLFTGPCGMGKSTQADLWRENRGLEIINGDKSILFEKDGEFWASGLPNSGSSIYCVNKAMPIKAIVKLSQAPYNKVEKLNTLESFLSIYKGFYPVAYSEKIMNMQISLAERIGAGVDVYQLECLPNVGAVECLERIING